MVAMELHFRNITDDDLAMILKWRTMPEVSAYMYTDVEPDMEKHRQWYRRICADLSRLDWIIRVDGEDVGLVSIVDINRQHHRALWGYYVASTNVRGKGIGRSVELNVLRYVFEELQLHKLCGEVFASNELVVKIHQKYGSKVEGTRPEQIYKNGKYYDIVEIGILRDNWKREIKGKIEYVEAVIDPPEKEMPALIFAPEPGREPKNG